MPSLREFLRHCPVVIAAFACLSAATGQSDLSSEPFNVYVAIDGAYARCGPAGEYYRTDELRHGQSLEVYAETDDGWLGIRPPADSFCWIVADAIELNDRGEDGVVIEDKTVAWIGTHLGRARKYRWQVQLAKGEPVSVLGRSEREGPDGPQLWYRIVPPSGEFRWVHRDQVVESSEELVATASPLAEDDHEFLPAARIKPASPQLARNNAETSESRADMADAVRPSRRNSAESSGPSILQADPSAVGSGLKQDWQANHGRQASQSPPTTLKEAVTRGGLLASVEFLGGPRLTEIGSGLAAPAANDVPVDSNWVAGVSRRSPNHAALPNPAQPWASSNPIQQVAALEPLVPSVTNANHFGSGKLTPTAAPNLRPLPVVSPQRIAAVQAETEGADVERLSLMLSRLMASRASAEEAEPVARAASQMATSGTDPVRQGRARLLAERVRQYQRLSRMRLGEPVIQADRVTTAGSVDTVSQASLSPPPLPPPPFPTAPNPPASGASSTVAQVGYLVQVYSARTNSPPYALTDHSGRTVAYVTPSPGVNIRMHMNSQVKVIGQQGFLRGLNTPHILVTQASRTLE
jgi:hypothetical protein